MPITAAAASTLMSAVPSIVKSLESTDSKKKRGAGSLIELTKSTRNDFLTVVQDDLIALPYMPDVMQSVLSIVSGYFLSAVSIVVDVPGIDVDGTLNQLNANRDPTEEFIDNLGSNLTKMVGTESLAFGLPKHNVALEQFIDANVAKYQTIGLEEYTEDDFNASDVENPLDRAKIRKVIDDLNNSAERYKNDKARAEALNKAQDEINAVKLDILKKSGASAAELAAAKLSYEKSRSEDTASVGYGKDTVSTLKEVSNLSVGKVFNVTFARNGNSLEIPVTLALAVNNTDQQSMFNILTYNANNSSFKERYYRYKAGELAYVKDLIFCQDMIEESRRQRIKDKSGFLENMMSRSRKNFWSGLFSQKVSLNNASSVLIVSEDTVRKAALDIGGKLDKFTVREKVFKNTACMLIVVVDTKWETVRIYHRSIANYTELSVRELKRSAKGGGADVEDILKAFSAGSAPVL